MKNTINNILRGLKSIKVESIVKGDKVLIGAILIAITVMFFAYSKIQILQTVINDNDEVIFYSQELKKVREEREVLYYKEIELISDISEAETYEECTLQQIDRIVAGMGIELDYCDGMDSEDEAFSDEIIKELFAF